VNRIARDAAPALSPTDRRADHLGGGVFWGEAKKEQSLDQVKNSKDDSLLRAVAL